MTVLAGVSLGLLVAYWSLSWRIDWLTEAKYDFLHGLVLLTVAEDHEPLKSYRETHEQEQATEAPP